MKIDLKLTIQQFLALSRILDFMESHGNKNDNSRDTKLIKSVMYKVVLRVHKKRLEINSEINLFTEKKKVKVQLEYFEAFFLETYLGIVQQNPLTFAVSEYDRNVLLMVSSELNQKLV